MPFRERVKRVFGRSPSTTDSSSSLSKTSSRKSSAFYQPGEAMPRPKYRQPVDKKHKECLEAFNFSFGADGRRKSVASTYSPMGSKWPSRQNSFDAGHGGLGHGASRRVLTDLGLDTYNDSSVKSTPQHLEHTSDSSSDTENRRPLTAALTHDLKPFSENNLRQALERSNSKGQSRAGVV